METYGFGFSGWFSLFEVAFLAFSWVWCFDFVCDWSMLGFGCFGVLWIWVCWVLLFCDFAVWCLGVCKARFT